MASPSVFSQNTTQSTGVTDTSHPVTFPTHAAGDMLLVDAIFDGNPNVTVSSGTGWATDWNVKNTTGGTTPTSVGLSKLAGGASETLTLASDVGEASLIAVRVVRGGGGTLNVFAATPTTGSSANGTGPAVSPGAGAQDMLYCLSYGQDGVAHASVAPSGYSNFVGSANGTASRVDVATCEKAATASSSDTPGAWTAAAEQWISGAWAVWESASGASQSIAFTLEDVTASFAQTAEHPQSLAATLDGISVSIAQTLDHSQALAATLDDVSASIAQTLERQQSFAITLDDVDVAINQSIGAGNSQTISFTLDGVTVAIAQTASHPQSLAATLDGVTVAVAQTVQHPQALAVTLDGVSVDIQQSVSPANKDQALAVTLDDVVASINQIGPAVLRRHAGTRKNYIIKGQKYALTDWELRLVIQQMLDEVKRPEVQVVTAKEVKQVSRRVWRRLKESLSSLEALTLEKVETVVQSNVIEYDDEDDDELLMLL